MAYTVDEFLKLKMSDEDNLCVGCGFKVSWIDSALIDGSRRMCKHCYYTRLGEVTEATPIRVLTETEFEEGEG